MGSVAKLPWSWSWRAASKRMAVITQRGGNCKLGRGGVCDCQWPMKRHAVGIVFRQILPETDLEMQIRRKELCKELLPGESQRGGVAVGRTGRTEGTAKPGQSRFRQARASADPGKRGCELHVTPTLGS